MSEIFLQVFQLHQFIKNQTKINSNVTRNIENDLGLEKDSRCRTIISLLKQNRGLKNYLSNQFQENDITLISIMFNHCCKIYSSQFDDILIKVNKNTINKYQYQVWKQKDLVPLIFKFLNLNEINACSKVNCSWLYHAFNPSCMPDHYFLNRQIGIRNRQRMSAVKSLQIENLAEWNNYSWICSLKRLICLCIDDIGSNVNILDHIGSSSIANQLQALCLRKFTINGTMSLSLPNLHHLRLERVDNRQSGVFPIFIIPLCHTLRLVEVTLNNEWCRSMSQIKHLQNIQKIILRDVDFGCLNEPKYIKQFALSLTYVKYLHLEQNISESMLLLWKNMNNTIHQNHAKVFLHIIGIKGLNSNLLHFIQGNRLKIHRFYSCTIDLQHKDVGTRYQSGYAILKNLLLDSNKCIESLDLMFFKRQSWDDFCDLLSTNNGNNVGTSKTDKISVFPSLSSIVVTAGMSTMVLLSSIHKFLLFVQNQQHFQKCGICLWCTDIHYSCKQDLQTMFEIIRDLINQGVPTDIGIHIRISTSDAESCNNQLFQLQNEVFTPIFGVLLTKLDEIQVNQHWYYDPVRCPTISFSRHREIDHFLHFIAQTADVKDQVAGQYTNYCWKVAIDQQLRY